jgi:hypothetical protein
MRQFPSGCIPIKHPEVKYLEDMAVMGVLFYYIYIVRAFHTSINGGYPCFCTAMHETLPVVIVQSSELETLQQ